MKTNDAKNGFSAGRLDHYNISTRILDETVRFYVEVLGFENGPRPPFNFPGAWLYCEGIPVLHLNDIAGSDAEPASGTGVIEHIAFRSRGFKAMKRRLEELGMVHRVNQVPGRPLWQIFLHDPNGVEIELNFTAPGIADN
jgi:catechol 2,3-dioxygenase-like lactoylglutathione lyase family enzyme